MLLSNSPVKNIVERLNPFSQKNKISRLKFERKSDYKTFLKFIKDNTKEIKDIEIPDSEDKKNKGLMIGGGILGLALLGTLGGGKRDSDGDGTGKLQSISGVIQKAKTESIKASSGGKKIKKTDQSSDVLDKTRSEKLGDIEKRRNIIKKKLRLRRISNYLKFREQRKIKKKFFTNQEFKFSTAQKDLNQEIGGDTNINKKSTTTTRAKITPSGDPLNIEQRQFADRNRLGLQDDIENFQKIDLGAEEQIKEAKKIKLQDKLKIKSDIRLDRQEKANRALNVLDDFEADSARRAAIEDAEIKKTRSKIDKSKFFDAPDIPKRKNLSGLDNFNRFSSNIFNNPFVRLTSSVFGFIVNAKGEILRTTLTPTQLGPTDEEERRLIEQFSDKPVNIFLNNGNQSMLPFDTGVPSRSTSESNGLISSTNDFFENTPSLSIEDLFFIKMEGT